MSFLKDKPKIFSLLNLSGPSEKLDLSREDSKPVEDGRLSEDPTPLEDGNATEESLGAVLPNVVATAESPIQNDSLEVGGSDSISDPTQATEEVPEPEEHSGGVRIIRPATRIFASKTPPSEDGRSIPPAVDSETQTNPFDEMVAGKGEAGTEAMVSPSNEDSFVATNPLDGAATEEPQSKSQENVEDYIAPAIPINPFDQVVSNESDSFDDDDSAVTITQFGQTPVGQANTPDQDDDEPEMTIKPLHQAGIAEQEADTADDGSEITIQSFPNSNHTEDQAEESHAVMAFNSDEPADDDGGEDVGFVIVRRDPGTDPILSKGDENVNPRGDFGQGADAEGEMGSEFSGKTSQGNGEESAFTETSDDTSIAVRSTLQKKYTPEELREFAQYLPKTVAGRYEAIILNSWTTGFNTRQFEVGLVHIKNGDHRNGVLRTLKVSPLDVRFIPLDEEVFNYLHESIYDPKAEVEAKIQEQKKQSQKTKAWGEGQSTLSPEEAFAIQAAEMEFDIGSEEWMDLTNIEEYERNIKRSESELTTQEFIRLILMEFLRSGSSDMHIESGQPTGRIRFRYDSEMFTRWDDIPFVKIKQVAAGLAETAGKDATRMKFKDIDSTIKVKALRDGVPADVELRFASQPTLYSPSIVLRSQLKPIRDLNVVGFLPRQVEDLEVAYSQKRGIIVVTGATGSGKTNTLESIYAKLEETDKFKIIEIGEPIEIRSGRRTQISLRPNTPFTWWDAFYSCLRSDPDIIGIGELRSAEHLSVAINAALTGHLVLSTFHAASVEDTLTRMFQMGIPRENLATGINMILAQTLIKRLCEKCKVVDETASEQYGKTVYKSAGCPECFNKGTRGRTAMAELLYFSDEVKQWIQDKNMSARDVVQRATREGHLLPMKLVAREKVIAGLASTHETSGALGYLESSESWNNGGSFNYSEEGDKPHTQEISPGDIPIVEDFIEGEIIEE